MTARICPGPLRRREFLQAGSLALGGLGLADVLRGRAQAGQSGRETSVILLYLHGGPSQLETYDLKPTAPTEYRSVFGAIPTNVLGIDLCELFPLQAKIADKLALVRSVHHTMSSHTDGGIEVMTGKTPVRPDPTSQSKSEHPDLGSVVAKVRGPHPAAIPRYVAIPQALYMTRPGYLGMHHGAFAIGDPSTAGWKPPDLSLVGGLAASRFDERRGLRRDFDRWRRANDLRGSLEGADQFRELAFHMLTGSQVARAFDLSQEPDALRDRYGRHLWGQGCLLARRLAEAGTSVITLYIDTPKTGPDYTNWDDHIMNAGRPGHFADFMRRRLPYLDQALSALIEDIFARGVDEQIAVAVLGEFGRTPRLSHNANGTGRDHWPDSQTVLLAGGGFKLGQAIGATNSKAEYPTERPLTPKDILATLYRHLGIDPSGAFSDHAGRPVPILGEGQPIAELF
ncbi:MAG: DUF1501 domain-containing protein [Planctomycetes bacterium]|nr:DUF1501 domain-containing protein [Planctomycetota bacterium]